MLSGFAAESARIIKVLPHFLDKKGRHSLAPSLYERDAYQEHLRENPERRSTIRYDVQWKGPKKTPLTMRVELRGSDTDKQPKSLQVEKEVTCRSWGSCWSGVALEPRDFADFSEILAWRVTLWQGETLLAEQQSFLW